MDVKQAVQTAKEHVAHLFADEHIMNVGLEEVEFDEVDKLWAITIGFSRWGRPGNVMHALDGDLARTYKIVRIQDESGRVESVRHRDVTGSQLVPSALFIDANLIVLLVRPDRSRADRQTP